MLHPFGLALLHEKLYWTDWSANAVYRANINSGANVTRLTNTAHGRPMDIHAYSIIPKQGKYNTKAVSNISMKGDNEMCPNH